MLFTVAPPACVAKYSTKKNTGHGQTDHGNGSSLKLNSLKAVKLKNTSAFFSLLTVAPSPIWWPNTSLAPKKQRNTDRFTDGNANPLKLNSLKAVKLKN